MDTNLAGGGITDKDTPCSKLHRGVEFEAPEHPRTSIPQSPPGVLADFCLIGTTNGIIFLQGSGNLLNVGPMPGATGQQWRRSPPGYPAGLLPSTKAVVASSRRGSPFLRLYDGDGVGGPRIDMGVIEFPAEPDSWRLQLEWHRRRRRLLRLARHARLNHRPPPTAADPPSAHRTASSTRPTWKSHFGNTFGSAAATHIATLSSAELVSTTWTQHSTLNSVSTLFQHSAIRNPNSISFPHSPFFAPRP